MAREALKQKQQRIESARIRFLEGKTTSFQICKHYNRCKLCGRTHGYIRDFGICRVCFRKYAREGMIVGMRKAAW